MLVELEKNAPRLVHRKEIFRKTLVSTYIRVLLVDGGAVKKMLGHSSTRKNKSNDLASHFPTSATHDARTQSPRVSTASLQPAVGPRGLGPTDQEEQRTQRASFVATYHTREHTAAAAGGHRAGRGCSVEKNTT